MASKFGFETEDGEVYDNQLLGLTDEEYLSMTCSLTTYDYLVLKAKRLSIVMDDMLCDKRYMDMDDDAIARLRYRQNALELTQKKIEHIQKTRKNYD